MARERTNRPPLVARLGRGLVFAAYVVGTTVLLLELGLHLLWPQPLTLDAPQLYAPDPAIGWRHVAGARATVQWQSRVEVCIDAEGDRVACDAAPRECTRNVLAVGDSYTEALGLAYRETVWHRLEADTGACVHAAGVGGYGPMQYLATLRERLGAPGASFDLVIVSIYAGNDFFPRASEMPASRQVARERLRWLPPELSKRGLRSWVYPVNQYLESRSHAFVAFRNVVKRTFYDDWMPYALQRSRLQPEVIEASLAPIRALVAAARASGVPVLAVLIPVRDQVLDPDGAELVRAFPALRGDLDMDLTAERILPALRAIPGLRVVDLLPALRARADRAHWGEFDRHFSPAGHAVWFDAIRAEVRELMGSAGYEAGTRAAVPPVG